MEESLIDVYYKNFLDNKRKYIYFNSECYNTNYIDKQSDSLLMFLLDKNIKKNERVVVLLPRGIDLLVSIVAVIKAGATYVPVDVNITQDDLDYIIEDSGATYVILSSTESRYVFSENINVIREEHLLFKYDKTCKIGFTYKNLKYNRDINSIAYIIYTSGTSGHPKGVMVGDQNIISTMKACCRRLELDNEKFLIKSNKAFDFSIFELLVIFFSGNSVFILPEGDERDPQKVLDYIIENEITTLTYVPTGFSYFLDYIERNDKSQRCDKVHKILLGGEKVDKSLVLQANSVFPQAEIWNLYGPTEATFCSSMFKIEDPDYITIGTALEGEKLEIRDSNGKTCDILITGEIVILGTGISKGYTKNKLNRNKFVFNSEFSEYKTGDLGYIDNYGNIVIVGRNDDEIKRNGYRISINSLEESIREEFPKLLFKLMFFDKNNYSREICLFYIVQSAISKNDILSKLSQRLPSYMLPNKYISLNSFPLKNSGKIDNNKLKKIFEENFLDVSTITKQLELNMDSLALIWKKVLGISQLNYNDSFFAIGGTSLNVVELTLEIEESLNFIISTSDVYENDTIESQFLFISQKISNQSIQRKITHNNETEICRFNIYDLETKNTDIKLSGEGTFQEITDLMNYKFFQNKKRDVLTFSIPIKCENERFDEFDINVAASIREYFKLEGQNRKTAKFYRDKFHMNKVVSEIGLKAPKTERVSDIFDVLEFGETFGYPIIVKPVMGAGTYNTIKLNCKEDIKLISIREFGQDYIVQEFIEGELYHIDALKLDGKIAYNIVSKYYYPTLEHFKGHSTSSCQIRGEESKIFKEYTENLLSKIPTTHNSLFHLEIIYNGKNIYFLEIGSRLGGGGIQPIIMDQYNIDPFYMYVLAELNEYNMIPEIIPQNELLYGFIMVAPKVGKVVSLPEEFEIDLIKERCNIFDIHFFSKIGKEHIKTVNSIQSICRISLNPNYSPLI